MVLLAWLTEQLIDNFFIIMWRFFNKKLQNKFTPKKFTNQYHALAAAGDKIELLFDVSWLLLQWLVLQNYSFASTGHPDEHSFATGNQGKCYQVWNIRKLSSPIAILKGTLVRQFMVVAKPEDFVHVYSKKLDYQKHQEIDFFGEIFQGILETRWWIHVCRNLAPNLCKLATV